MRFWDASAAVRLAVEEPLTAGLRALYDVDGAIAVWWMTRVECASAITRRRRDGTLTESGARDARAAMRALADAWSEVQPRDRIRAVAERLLAVHDLRAGDALQLAAALEWCDGNVEDAHIVCVDRRLRVAAMREGFVVLPEEIATP